MSPEIILALIKPLLVLGLLLTNTIILIWLERKVVAGMQSRVGPDKLVHLEYYKLWQMR